MNHGMGQKVLVCLSESKFINTVADLPFGWELERELHEAFVKEGREREHLCRSEEAFNFGEDKVGSFEAHIDRHEAVEEARYLRVVKV